jgi:hypothetical protein
VKLKSEMGGIRLRLRLTLNKYFCVRSSPVADAAVLLQSPPPQTGAGAASKIFHAIVSDALYTFELFPDRSLVGTRAFLYPDIHS